MIATHITSLILKHETEKIKIVFILGTLFSRRKKKFIYGSCAIYISCFYIIFFCIKLIEEKPEEQTPFKYVKKRERNIPRYHTKRFLCSQSLEPLSGNHIFSTHWVNFDTYGYLFDHSEVFSKAEIRAQHTCSVN